jgi:hypothetical protein
MIGIKKISKPKKLCKSTIYVWVNIRKSSIDEKSEINIYIYISLGQQQIYMTSSRQEYSKIKRDGGVYVFCFIINGQKSRREYHMV